MQLHLTSLLFAAALSAACATAPKPPQEQLAYNYAQAFLRRDMDQMRTMTAAASDLPPTNVALSSLRIVRTCSLEEVPEQPGAQSTLVLLGDPEWTRFYAIRVTMQYQDASWLVTDAHMEVGSVGRPTLYSRTCQPYYVTGAGVRY